VVAVVVSSENEPVCGRAGTVTLPDDEPLQGVGVEPDVPWPTDQLDAWKVAAATRISDALCEAIAALASADKQGAAA
jgi:C-terminal processing protease CtpA/Prc